MPNVAIASALSAFPPSQTGSLTDEEFARFAPSWKEPQSDDSGRTEPSSSSSSLSLDANNIIRSSLTNMDSALGTIRDDFGGQEEIEHIVHIEMRGHDSIRSEGRIIKKKKEKAMDSSSHSLPNNCHGSSAPGRSRHAGGPSSGRSTHRSKDGGARGAGMDSSTHSASDGHRHHRSHHHHSHSLQKAKSSRSLREHAKSEDKERASLSRSAHGSSSHSSSRHHRGEMDGSAHSVDSGRRRTGSGLDSSTHSLPEGRSGGRSRRPPKGLPREPPLGSIVEDPEENAIRVKQRSDRVKERSRASTASSSKDVQYEFEFDDNEPIPSKSSRGRERGTTSRGRSRSVQPEEPRRRSSSNSSVSSSRRRRRSRSNSSRSSTRTRSSSLTTYSRTRSSSVNSRSTSRPSRGDVEAFGASFIKPSSKSSGASSSKARKPSEPAVFSAALIQSEAAEGPTRPGISRSGSSRSLATSSRPGLSRSGSSRSVATSGRRGVARSTSSRSISMASVAHEEAAPKERTQEALKGDVSSVELTSDSNHSVGDSRGVRRAKSSVAALGGAFRAGLSLSMHKRTIGDDEVSVTDRSLTRGVARAKSSTAAIGSLFSSLGRSMQRGRPTAETDMYKMHQSNGDLGLDDLDLQL